MLGLIYIIICIFTGRALLDIVYPDYRLIPENAYSGKEIHLPALFVLFPFWFFSGTLVVGWLTYFAALAVSALRPYDRHPLTIANAAVMTAATVFIIITAILKRKTAPKTARGEKPDLYKDLLCAGFFVILFFFITYLTCRSFNIVQNTLRVGYSVFSDFAVHLGMIRSFSFGNNFPTQYSHFAGEDIRYHFMFEFLAGNLEYLGLPIDHAFNFPSILSFMSMSMLLFSFTVKLCGSRLAGVISTFMMVFRSSPSLFRFLGSLSKGGITKEEFLNRDQFFSYTPKEDWGLWNFKVYLNQRHLAFGIGVVLMALIIFAPLLYEGIKNIRDLFSRKKTFKASSETEKGPAVKSLIADHVLINSLPRAVFCGVLLGVCAFWNGAMVIGGLCVLFVMALMSSHRLEYLLTAVISVILSMIQTKIFIFGDVIAPEYMYGFIAEVPTFWGSISYLLALSGALLILAAVFFIMGRGVLRYLLLAFCAPLIFAFTVSLTPDVTVNHKYVMLAFILMGIPVAVMVTMLLKSSRLSRFIGGVFLLIILTATGIYECRIVRNIDKDHLEFRQDSDLTKWVKENSTSKDIWLTDMISNHEIVLGGAMLYYGWPYYAWSAGYDTYAREEKTARMFAASDEEELKRMISEEGIRFIMTDDGLRYGDHYELNEDVIAAAYPVVYQSGDVKIYDTESPR